MPPGVNDRAKYFYEAVNTLKDFKTKYSIDNIIEEQNRALRDILEHNFERLVVSFLDIANYYIAEKRLPKPKSNVETFKVLSGAGLMQEGEKEIFTDFVKQRNIITHEYSAVDYNKIYSLLEHILKLVDLFEKIVSEMEKTEI